MKVDYDIVKYCSIECKLQMSGELSVGWMVDGFIYADQVANYDNNMYESYLYHLPNVSDVLNLGKLIEPNDNALGFRTCGVRVGWDVKMDWQLVPEQIVNLMESVAAHPAGDSYGLTPDQFFWEYEQIHPFRDGNGRTGAILFNWLNKTLDHPVWPLNCFNDPRRTVGYGA